MNRFRMEAFMKEFPALQKFVEREKLDLDELRDIRVSRLDEVFLSSRPFIRRVTGSLVDIFEGNKVFLVTRGEEFLEVEGDYSFRSNYAHEEPYDKEGHTVLEDIDEVGVENLNPNLPIIELEVGLETVNHHSRGFKIILWKPSKRISLTDLIKTAKEKALAEVKAEAEF